MLERWHRERRGRRVLCVLVDMLVWKEGWTLAVAVWRLRLEVRNGHR